MRDVTVSVETVLGSSNVPMLALVELDFSSGFVRATNAGYDIQWNGYTWIGLGQVGGISQIQEGRELEMHGCALTLSGIPSEYISLAMSDEYQGRNATIYTALLDEDHQIIADPIITFKGRMDTMRIAMGQTATIELSIESMLTDWERPRVRRYNHEDQISEYPNDKGFEFVAQMAEKELVWGRPTP